MAEDKTDNLENIIQGIIRFNYQCILIEQWNFLKEENQKNSSYKSFIMLDEDPANVVQELVGKKDIEGLLSLTPAQRALMVPKIRISKVYYDRKDGKDGGREQELFFRDHTSKKTIDNMVRSSRERGDDVGIKKFEYSLTGRQPGEGGYTQCQLTLFFQNIACLLSKGVNGVAFKDLILNGRNKQDLENPLNYHIKVVVGWGDPQDATGTVFPKGKEGAALRQAIRNSRTILSLQLYDYDLDFRENGSIEMTSNYYGSMEGIMNNEQSNILYLSRWGKIAEELKKKKDGEKYLSATQMTEVQSQIKKSPSSVIVEDKAKDVDVNVLSSEKTINENAITILDSLDNQEKYSRLLESLYNSGKIYYMDVSKDYFEIASKAEIEQWKLKRQSGTEQEKKDLQDDAVKSALSLRAQQKRVALKQQKIVKLEVMTQERTEQEKKNIKSAISNGVGSNPDYESSNMKLSTASPETRQSKLAELDDRNTNLNPKDGTKRIHFFFLGDLLDIVLNGVLFEPTRIETRKGLRVVLGPIKYEDPTDVNNFGKNPVECNLADIPISLDVFISWYMKKVVQPLASRYLLGIFINDVISDLVIPALESDCYTGIKQNAKINVQVYTTVSKNDYQNGQRISLGDIRNNMANKSLNVSTSHEDFSDLTHYLYIYVSSWPLMGLKGDRNADQQKGIYHFSVGKDRGLVKSIKFHKETQPYLREARMHSDSSDLKRMTGKYTLSMTMIGNTLLSKDQYFFIDTSNMTTIQGSDSSGIAADLGLGGYYQAKEIKYVFSRDEFVTEVEATRVSDATSLEPNKKAITTKITLASDKNVGLAVAAVEKKKEPDTIFAKALKMKEDMEKKKKNSN